MFNDFYLIQALTDNAIYKTLTNSTNSKNIHIYTKTMDIEDISRTIIKQSSLESFILYMTLFFAPSILALLNHLVVEKESKIKESMLIIGLKNSSFWLSWAIIYSFIILFNSVIATVMLYQYKLTPFIHWSVMIFIMVIYGLSCCCVSFILSTFLKKSKIAMIISGFIIFTFYIISNIILIMYKYYRKTMSFISIFNFFFPPSAFVLFFKKTKELEYTGQIITFSSILKNKTIFNSFICLIFTFILYFFIAIYLDNILPQGNNIHRKWHFFITDIFKNKNKKLETNISNININNPFIQPDPKNQKLAAVEVRHIKKKFNVKYETIHVLNDISFNAYYDEIFAILGHNGAGKTTLMSIMTGILPSNYGDVYYDNIPISGNVKDICKDFGYCPQFDAFNNNLTVSEHIKLYAGFKNIKVNIDEILEKFNLLDKKNEFPKHLSGGQKRKLSIALALLGSPKFIFLDEPTAGLDPYSRKMIWNILSERKKGCVIFITTHYLDEADFLADRKMIISNGNISCLGTSTFLKNSYNMNYSLDVYSDSVDDTIIVDNIIKFYCYDSIKSKKINIIKNNNQMDDDEINNEIDDLNKDKYITTYLLPISLSKSFKDIFNHLNDLIKSSNNGITNFSVTAPTLEEVFIRIENHDPDNKKLKRIMKQSTVYIKLKDENLFSLDELFKKRNINKYSSIRQIYSIIKIRLKIFLKSKSFLIFYTLIPLFLLILVIFIEYTLITKKSDISYSVSLKINENIFKDKGLWIKDTTSTGQALDIINNISSETEFPLIPINYKKELTFKSGKLASNSNNYIGGFKGTEINDQNLKFIIYHNCTHSLAIPVALNFLSNSLLKYNNINEKIDVTYIPFVKTNSLRIKIDYYSQLNSYYNKMEPLILFVISFVLSFSISIYGPLTVRERELGITHQLFINGTKPINYWIGLIIGDAICVLALIIIFCIVSLVLDVSIFTVRYLPITLMILIFWTLASLLYHYIFCHFFKKYDKISSLLTIINPVITIFNGVYAFIIYKNNIEPLMRDSNLDFKLNNDIYSYISVILYTPGSIFIVLQKFAIFIIAAFFHKYFADIQKIEYPERSQQFYENNKYNIEELKEEVMEVVNNKLPPVTHILNEKNQLVKIIIILFSLMFIYAFILYIIEKRNLKQIRKSNIYSKEEREILDKKLKEGPKDVYSEWKRVKKSLNNTKYNNIENINEIIKENMNKIRNENIKNTYIKKNVIGKINYNGTKNTNIALKICELNKDFELSFTKSKKIKKEIKNASLNTNEYVNLNNKNHKENSLDSTIKLGNRIFYNRKEKKYINKIVNDTTYGVNNGECLGVLGPNGAGKTTSISMITGILSHTHGRVVYGDKDLNKTELTDLSLGYCSQIDALWKVLTVKETIEFYLDICGYPKKDIPRYIKALTETCGMENHINKKVKELSGGTRRKLSLIVAICSSPKYLILDEPSVGLDPFTRRYMWKIITELKKVRNSSIILTTHSTEEAEALCERIAILIEGRLVFIDTPESIKMNYNRNYTLEVSTNFPDKFEEFVNKNNLFGLGPNEKYQLETSAHYQKYFVEMKTKNISKVFSLLEKAKEKYIIGQYNFGQYSLEQVYINFINNIK